MMKSIFDLIFAKNTYTTFASANQHTAGTSSAMPNRTTLLNSSKNAPNSKMAHKNINNIDMPKDEIESSAVETSYEVAEISLDEFRYTGPERRKFPRKPGETRSCYTKNKNPVQSTL